MKKPSTFRAVFYELNFEVTGISQRLFEWKAAWYTHGRGITYCPRKILRLPQYSVLKNTTESAEKLVIIYLMSRIINLPGQVKTQVCHFVFPMCELGRPIVLTRLLLPTFLRQQKMRPYPTVYFRFKFYCRS